MIGLNLSASKKIAVISIINSKLLLYGKPNILVFLIVKFLHLELFFFHCVFFKKNYPILNKPQIHTNIIDISSF